MFCVVQLAISNAPTVEAPSRLEWEEMDYFNMTASAEPLRISLRYWFLLRFLVGCSSRYGRGSAA